MSEATLEAARGGGRGCVPFPAAGTNTLCVSDSATLALVPTLVPTVPTPPSVSSSVSAASTDSPARNTLTESKRTSSSSEKLVLSFRVGDSRSPWGSHLASVEVRLHLHRWNPRGGVGHTSRELSLRCKGEPGVGTKGGLRVSLWAPVVVEHEVDAHSPLRSALVEGWPVNRSPDRLPPRVSSAARARTPSTEGDTRVSTRRACAAVTPAAKATAWIRRRG